MNHSRIELLNILDLIITFVDIDECLSNPCQHGGSCADTINGYTCSSCEAGYVGPDCETGECLIDERL